LPRIDVKNEENLPFTPSGQILVSNDTEILKKTIDSRHSGRKASRNGPSSRIGPQLSGKTEKGLTRIGESRRENAIRPDITTLV
jgi:hypothetical protein